MNTPNRFVVVTFAQPFFHLKFVDLDSENSTDWQHNQAEGEIVVDSRNEPGLNAVNLMMQTGAKLWSQGAEFRKIARTFPDT